MWRRRRTVVNEFDEMERRMDEFFERISSSFEPMWDVAAQTLKPLYEVRETRDSLIVLVDLPYVEKEAIQLTVDKGSIDLTAELRQPVKYDRWGTTQRECEFNKLCVTIPLPTEVDPDGAKARFREGVLAVELPKKTKKTSIKIE